MSFLELSLTGIVLLVCLIHIRDGSRVLQHLLTFIVLACLTNACQSSSVETPADISTPNSIPSNTRSQPRTTITFACYDYELSAYRDLVRQFEETQPAVAVQVLSIDEILGADTGGDSPPEEAALRVMSAADTARWFVTPQESQQGLFRDLAPFIEGDVVFEPEDYFPGLLEAFQWQGGTWSLPAGGELSLMFFDKQAFDEAREPYPEPGWSWADFVHKAQALTRREGDEASRYGYVPALGVGVLEAYLADHDAPLQDRTTDPPGPLLDSPAVMQGVGWYVDLVREHQAAPGFTSEEAATQSTLLIEEGRAAMWSDLALNYGSGADATKVGVVPFPGGGQTGTTPLVVYGYVMSAGTARPEAAWRWLSFLSRQEPVGWSSDAVPARRSVAQASGLWERLEGERAEVYRYALAHALVQAPRAFNPMRRALWQAVDAVLGGEREVQEALAAAQQAVLTGGPAALPTVEVQVAAAPSPPPEQAADGGVTITFVGGSEGLGGAYPAYRKLAESFHQDHPDIAVDVQPDQCFSRGWCDIPTVAANSDCFESLSGIFSPEDVTHILSLDPFLDAEPDFPQDDYYPVFWNLCQHQGQLLCLPFDGSVGVIRYHESLFDAAGVDYPRPGWTLDDLLDKAVALTQEEGTDEQYGFSEYYFGQNVLRWVVDLRGGSLWDVGDAPPRPQFDDPAVVEAVRWYADLSSVHGVMLPTYLPLGEDNADVRANMQLVEARKVAMWFLPPSGYVPPAVASAGIAPLPQHDGRSTPYVYAQAYYLSAQAEHPRACWQWLRFLSDQLEPVDGVPVRRSQAESTAFRRKAGEETADVYLHALEQAGDHTLYEVERQNPWMLRALRWFYQAYSAALDGADAAQALGAAQYKAEAFYLCLATQQGFDDAKLRLTCALEVDPDYPVPSSEKHLLEEEP
jgi:ABC-type glycerol-3-phosphate transport system substrate-binding protein